MSGIIKGQNPLGLYTAPTGERKFHGPEHPGMGRVFQVKSVTGRIAECHIQNVPGQKQFGTIGIIAVHFPG